MKYPVLQVCESLCPSSSVSFTSRCMLTPTRRKYTHAHVHDTAEAPEANSGTADRTQLPHSPTPSTPGFTQHSTCCPTPLKEEGRLPSSCSSISLSRRIPLLSPPPQSPPLPRLEAWLCSAFTWIHLSFLGWDHFIRSPFSHLVGWDWNPKLWVSLHILPHVLRFTR